MRIPVYLEVGSKRVFAGALDWPGWIVSGKDEEQALAALAAAADRYRPVAKAAGHALPKRADDFDVTERVKGNGTTDFGAPGVPARADSKPLTAAQSARQRHLVEACWRALDAAARKAPATLRKGPRGGGRDRDKMLEHVLGAEQAYGGRIGVRLKPPAHSAAAGLREFRAAILAGLEADPGPWPSRYAARRIAWHALFHAWEMEDRSHPAS